MTGRQAALAHGDPRAWRIDPAYGLFAAAADDTPESLAALAALVGHGETVGSVEPEAMPLPPGLRVVKAAPCVQMVAETEAEAPVIKGVALGDADAAEMLALATLTRPGPFFGRTHRFGGFVGVRERGRLVAMAGTRLAVAGHVEVSGVCTHPDHRGRGLAAGLIATVARAIRATGDTPFLTSYADNAAANALYERLGFRTRRIVIFTLLERA